MPNESKALALLDKDKAGKKTKSDMHSDACVIREMGKRTFKVIMIQPNENIIKIFSSGINFEYSIEHLFPISVWEHNKNFLEETIGKRYDLSKKLDKVDVSYLDSIERNIDDRKLKDYFLFKHIPSYKKNDFCESTINLIKEDARIVEDFKPLVKEIRDFII